MLSEKHPVMPCRARRLEVWVSWDAIYGYAHARACCNGFKLERYSTLREVKDLQEVGHLRDWLGERARDCLVIQL